MMSEERGGLAQALVAALGRHRAYLVALLAVVAVVAVVPEADDAPSVATAGGTAATVMGEVPDAGAGADGVTAGTTDVVTGVEVSSGSPSGSSGAGGAVAAPTSAGRGTDAALSAPDCDPATKRLKVSSIYAPPCAVPWPDGADNGGATAPGVSDKVIKVVAIRASGDTSNEDTQRTSWNDYVTMFEDLYRTWGRKVETTWFTTTGTDEAAQRADAIQVATLKPFAVLSPSTSLNGDVFVAELASRKIIVCCYSAVTIARAKALAPYLWGTILASPEGYELNLAQYAGRRLLGHPAKWAGDNTYKVTPRKFGLIYPDTWTADLGIFKREFSTYGGTLAEAMVYGYASSEYAAYQERARTIIAKLKAKGVTTVLYAGGLVFDPITSREATAQQYFPEWVIAGTGGQDLDIVGRTADQVQWQHAFGIASLAIGGDKLSPLDQLWEWYWGPEKKGRGLMVAALGIFYSGIHGAGPDLNANSFRDALFAVPPTGGAASGGKMSTQISFGRHGFFPWDDYNQGDDFSEVFWDTQARGKDALTCQATGGVCTEAVGKWRFLEGGRRYPPFKWPTGEPKFFDNQGTALWYAGDYPPGDAPPKYPCTGCPSGGG